MNKILVIDDDVTFCLMLDTFLKKKGFQVFQAFSFAEGVKKLQEHQPDIVLTDLRLPDNDGLEIIKKVMHESPDTPVILMTGYADIRTAVQAVKLGAYEYIAKPVNPDEVLLMIRKVLNPVKAPNPDNSGPADKAGFFVDGHSKAARKISEYVSLVAPTNMSVLIMGESGTGKEFIARKIHLESQRAGKTFIAIDCGALPRDLAGSEFFGHLKGSFTGAFTDKQGQFEAADGGTIFLDEIGNLSYDIQVQLLRAIQERKIRRIGSTTETSIDVRIITATNEDLKQAVAKGEFREDLYHRINEFAITVAPLRQRPEDLLLFARHFLRQANLELAREVHYFSDDVIDIFSRYSWPGNFREFRNIIKRAVLLTRTDTIMRSSLPEELVNEALQFTANIPAAYEMLPAGEEQEMPESRNELSRVAGKSEKELIVSTLEKVRFNKSKAARMLNVDRKTLYNKMRQYNIPLQ